MDDSGNQGAIISQVHLRTPSVASFDGLDIGSVAILTFIMSTFGKAIIGKVADEIWVRVKGVFSDGSVKALPGHIELVFACVSRRTPVELVVIYSEFKMMRRDQKNLRYYVALAAGYTACGVPPKCGEVCFMDIIGKDTGSVAKNVFLRRSR